MDDKMKKSYEEYLTQHIDNVKLGFDWMLINLPELFEEFDADYLGSLISQHDSSKYGEEEFQPYAEYFYGDEGGEDVMYEFNKAWLHHQHHNPHHWQHWVLREDDGNTVAIEMPKECVIEMISDWWAFSWKNNNLYEIFSWYENNTEKHIFHENTKKLVEDILTTLKDKLDEIHN